MRPGAVCGRNAHRSHERRRDLLRATGQRTANRVRHGAILDHSQWDPQAEALSESYTTITYDVRGHGRTGGFGQKRYSIELFADDLHALLDELDVQRPALCGLSTGGCIAQVYAARHPERISGLVLAGTFGPPLLRCTEWLQRSALLRATIPPVRILGYERVESAMVWLTERFQRGAGGEYGNVERPARRVGRRRRRSSRR